MEVPFYGNLHFIKMKNLLIISLLATLPVLSVADSNHGNSLHAELQSLRDEVSALTARVELLEKQIDSGVSVAPAKESDNGILDRLTSAMQDRTIATHYPWMDASLWKKVETGMSPEAVIAILGEPSMTDPSLHKRIDTVYTYKGRHPGTGKKITGKIKFYRDLVVKIEAPQ